MEKIDSLSFIDIDIEMPEKYWDPPLLKKINYHHFDGTPTQFNYMMEYTERFSQKFMVCE